MYEVAYQSLLGVGSRWDAIGKCMAAAGCWDRTLGCRWQRLLECDVKWTGGPIGHSSGASRRWDMTRQAWVIVARMRRLGAGGDGR